MAERELLDWDTATIVNEFVDNSRLIVTGETPVPMRVALEPALPGVAMWEYWPIELVGYREGATPEVVTPFDVSLELDKYWGTKGIELVGATKTERFPRADAAD